MSEESRDLLLLIATTETGFPLIISISQGLGKLLS